MATRNDRPQWLLVVLLGVAFLSPGAWMVTRLPPIPVAKALTLATVCVWLVAVGLGAVALGRPDRRVVLALGATLSAIAASTAAGGFVFETLFYDLYADMSLLQWLAFPAMFVIAASLAPAAPALRRALAVVVGSGTALAIVLAFQQLTTQHAWVFGSTGYSITALAPIIPLAAGLGATASGRMRWAWTAAAATVAVALGALSGTTMGSLAAVFGVVVAIAALPGSPPRMLRRLATVLAAMMAVGLLVATVPAVSGAWVNPDSMERLGRNVQGRAYMWQGAQAMVAERPLLGFGPAGYRLAAAEYLPAEALQFGSDRPNDIDPAVYSPQSPHSLVWDIATRLGMVGLIAFAILLLVWALAVRDRVRESTDTASLRLPLAGALAVGLFSLGVNPPIFAIGLLLPVVAGLAVAPSGAADADRPVGAARTALVAAGIVVAALAAWLYVGEWRAYTAPAEDPAIARANSQAVLDVLPGHPVSMRRILEIDLLAAPDDAAVQRAQAACDNAPATVTRFAPNLVSLVTYSLAQAERTSRADLEWERGMLDRAAEVLPPTPALVAERLHLAVVSGDRAAVAQALPDARRWGTPYPLTASYLAAADALLGQ